jgi:hypothetical protein
MNVVDADLHLFHLGAFDLGKPPVPEYDQRGWRICSGHYRGWPGCGTLLPPASFFLVVDSRRKDASFRGVCRPCRLEIDQAIKEADPWLLKAQQSLRRHMSKWKRRWGIDSSTQLDAIYGLNARWLADQFQRAANRECCYCDGVFTTPDARLGWSNMTLDQFDPSQPPHRDNMRIACATCNRAKGDMTPEQWAQYQHGWRLRADHIVEVGWTPPPRDAVLRAERQLLLVA